MKFVRNSYWSRRAAAFCLLFAVCLSSSMLVLGSSKPRSLLGEIVVSGYSEGGEQAFVKVNGERAVSGRTFTSSGLIETSATTSADIRLGGVGHVHLSPNSAISLSFSETGISGKLYSGKIRVTNAMDISVNIETPDNALANEKGSQGSVTIDVQSGTTEATAETGLFHFKDGRPVGQRQTTSSGGSNLWLPLMIYGAIVGVAITAVVLNRSNNAPLVVVSPVR